MKFKLFNSKIFSISEQFKCQSRQVFISLLLLSPQKYFPNLWLNFSGYQRLDLLPDSNNSLPVKGQIVISLLSRDGHGTGQLLTFFLALKISRYCIVARRCYGSVILLLLQPLFKKMGHPRPPFSLF